MKAARQKRSVFVIMPFTETPLRKKDDLTEFFEVNLKQRIESDPTLKYQYVVRRSDDTFDITAKIVQEVFAADVVLCDLSGQNANPNVMYELGMRLSLTSKPVILFREENPENRRIFDIQGFYAFEYTPTQYRKLEEYIVGKLSKFESGEEVYESPVLKTLKKDPQVLAEINRKRVRILLDSLENQLLGLQRSFGGALDQFLGSRYPSNTDEVDALLVYFHKHSDALKKIKWEGLAFHPHVPPAMNAYLTELPLDGLIDDELERLINTHISEFFSTFLASDFAWTPPNFGVVLTFLTESKFLRELCNGAILLVRNPDAPESADIVKKMRVIMRLSIFGLVKEGGEKTKSPPTKRSTRTASPRRSRRR